MSDSSSKTVKMGVSPHFAKHIERAVEGREVNYLLGPADESPVERVQRFRDHAITYLIGMAMLERGVEGSITDFHLELVDSTTGEVVS